MYRPHVLPEYIADFPQVLRGVNHYLARLAFCDLHISLEDLGIAEDEFERGDRHGLWDCRKIENGLLFESGEVEETFVGMPKGVEHHVGAAVQGRFAVFGVEQVVEVGDMLGPDLFGPEPSIVIEVFSDVTDDVGLLEE